MTNDQIPMTKDLSNAAGLVIGAWLLVIRTNREMKA